MIKKRKLISFFLYIVFAIVILGAIMNFTSKKPEEKQKSKSVFLNLGGYNPQKIMSYASPLFTKAEKKEEKQSKMQKTETKKIKIGEKNIASTNLEIKNETGYSVDALSLSNEKRIYDISGKDAKILIIHTHACETYSDKSGNGIGTNKSYRTTDTTKNMVSIGERMTEIFEENNIAVIHDKTLCDYPAYNSSYVKSLGVIEWYLERYPEIDFVFDIHRDAIEDKDGCAVKLITDINGKQTAQAMIVCGTDAMGLSNPFWKDNLIFALKIQKTLEEMHPGFMRPLNLRKERFNMHKTKGSLLFEIGTHGNTQLEALRSAEILAEGIAKTLRDNS
ncbi:MAG: stage II sporulation protein P [Clostridia bacterium]|nr:stage II sporulation protein P [Clostridia bacterium]